MIDATIIIEQNGKSSNESELHFLERVNPIYINTPHNFISFQND